MVFDSEKKFADYTRAASSAQCEKRETFDMDTGAGRFTLAPRSLDKAEGRRPTVVIIRCAASDIYIKSPPLRVESTTVGRRPLALSKLRPEPRRRALFHGAMRQCYACAADDPCQQYSAKPDRRRMLNEALKNGIDHPTDRKVDKKHRI
jgi:hypothetical protein